MKRYILIYFLVLVMGASQCNRDSCYELNIQFDQNARIQIEDPVFYDNGVAGEVRQLKKKDNLIIATVCISDSINIPKNAVIHTGYMPAFGSYGIRFVPGTGNNFAKAGDLLVGSMQDSLDLSFAPVDSVIVEKAIEVMKDFNKKKDN